MKALFFGKKQHTPKVPALSPLSSRVLVSKPATAQINGCYLGKLFLPVLAPML